MAGLEVESLMQFRCNKAAKWSNTPPLPPPQTPFTQIHGSYYSYITRARMVHPLALQRFISKLDLISNTLKVCSIIIPSVYWCFRSIFNLFSLKLLQKWNLFVHL